MCPSIDCESSHQHQRFEYRYLVVPSSGVFLKRNPLATLLERTHTTILCANRQIYLEAAAILHSELTIIVRPNPHDDITLLSKEFGHIIRCEGLEPKVQMALVSTPHL